MMRLRRRQVVILAVSAACLVLVIGYAVHSRSASRVDAPMQAPQSPSTVPAAMISTVVSPAATRGVVDPTEGLEALMAGSQEDMAQSAERALGLAQKRDEWQAKKNGGYTRWGSQSWMKDPEYYAKLETEALAEECFARSVFKSEMSLYEEPAVGMESLKIFHNGFAELFRRDDMWKGILHAYAKLGEQISPDASLAQIVTASGHLEELRKLYVLSPLREQIQGREKLFLAANIQVLVRYQHYLRNYNAARLGTNGSPGVFREPCSVAQVAMMLAKRVDPQRYAGIERVLTSVRWGEEQKVEDLRSFVDLVLVNLKGFSDVEAVP